MRVFELRAALTAEDFDSLVAFYRDGLGLEPGDMWNEHGRGQLFHSGKAIIEILDKEHTTYVDAIEVGHRVSGQIRFTFQVSDIHTTVENARQYDPTVVSEPTLTPSYDLNARIESPDGFQITLFQVMADE